MHNKHNIMFLVIREFFCKADGNSTEEIEKIVYPVKQEFFYLADYCSGGFAKEIYNMLMYLLQERYFLSHDITNISTLLVILSKPDD